MSPCKHTIWLRLFRKPDQLSLGVSDRMPRLLDTLDDVDAQFPSVVLLVGGESKATALHQMGISGGPPRSKRAHGEVHLFWAQNTRTGNRAMLVADGHSPGHGKLGRCWNAPKCHESTVRHIPPGQLPEEQAVAVADHMYHRVLFPFADVVGLFVDDLGGLPSIVPRVVAWLEKGKPSTGPVNPWLVLVVSEDVEKDVVRTFYKLLRAATTRNLRDQFAGLRIVSLSGAPLPSARSPPAPPRPDPWDSFYSVVARAAEQNRRARLARHVLFSARHLAAFLQQAVDRIGHASSEPFDCIRAARAGNPVATDVEAHLAAFLRHFRSVDTLQQFAIPMVASSLVLDHYPPGMHPFAPQDVFHALYKEACHRVSKKWVLAHDGSGQLLLPSAFLERLEAEMVRRFDESQEAQSAVAQHSRLIGRHPREWADLMSEDTCFHCIRRRPSFAFPCGHTVCETCVRMRGQKDGGDGDDDNPWVFRIRTCMLCQRDVGNIRIRVKPDTASVRVLSIDGGGTRGRAPLECLQVLQERLGLPCPVQSHFDVIYGTSSGAIIACALYVNGWPIEECIACFDTLARLAFQPRWWWRFRVPVLSRLFQPLFSLLVDSRYASRHLETVLQRVFGTSSMLDCSKASEMGAKIGIPVTTIQDASACVFTNYNGVGDRDDHADYHVLKPEGGVRQVPLWEIYFKPRHIRSLGTFQDGGLLFNNPTSIALREVAALFPTAAQPSLVVSLGTGSAKDASPSLARPRRLWKDSFPLRIFRAFWHYGSAKRAWQQLLSQQRVDRKDEFFRFDLEFEGAEPPLDDVSAMHRVGRLAREAMLASPMLDRLIRHIRAELFVFELDPTRPYKLVHGVFECAGHIWCRVRARTPAFEPLMAQLDQASAAFQVGSRVLSGSFRDASSRRADGHFGRAVKFHTTSRQEPFAISLREGEGVEGCHISGSPFTLQWLIQEQKLDAWFGTADHRKRGRGEEGGIPGGRHKRRRLC